MSNIFITNTKTCPPTPAGNAQVVEYMNRLKNILIQLHNTYDKSVAISRINILLEEVQKTYPYIS